ncbi:MAG TPA: hypothetical protein VNM43_02875 [Dehalococcoidia bacterium]|nr:hypothetical protein [Dehalococcoidia bacterium]
MPGDEVFFVQFPHPGREPEASTGDTPWNTHDHHHRKFLIGPGRYLDAEDRIREGELVFWGEWEPPSRVERRWPACGRLPRALHRPYWVNPIGVDKSFRQNTDPWVFGDAMLYSNCRQLGPRPWRRPNSMQRLTRGSVICFGSTIDGEFCVDTVFVVASAWPWTPASSAGLKVGAAFRTCTADSLMTAPGGAYLPLTLYRGATVKDPVEGMFTFVPSRPADVDDPRFARPQVRLAGLIDPSIRRAAWGSKRPLTIARVRDAWEAILEQVRDAGLVPAVWLQTPPRVTDRISVPGSSGRHC